MENKEFDFLGSGWSFPPAFDRQKTAVAMTAGVEDIEKSLEIILATRVGERLMLPDFGCNLDEVIFESMNTMELAYVKKVIETAILYHEPRIELEAVELQTDQSEGKLFINIVFKIRNTNSRFNFVYPFYLNEANQVI